MPKKCSNYCTIALSHASKIILKILQGRLQQYINHELPDVQVGFRKGRETRDQIANIIGSLKNQESSRKTSTSAYQGFTLSPCLFNLYAEYMRNDGLDEAQSGIKIAGRNTNNLTYADDTTLMAESKEEQKSLLMKMKEESEKVGLKLSIQKIKITASSPITSWQIDGGTVESSG